MEIDYPFSGMWEYQTDFVYTGTVSVLFFDKEVSSFGLFETNDVKVNKIQQTNIFILNKWRTHSAHWPMMSKLKCSEKSGYRTPQGKDFNSFNNISFTSKLCNIVKTLSF